MNTAEYIAKWDSIKKLRDKLQSGPEPEVFHLITTGHLMASERQEFGFPIMRCAECDAPVDLILNHDPIVWPAKILPPTVWGKDVTVICRTCSFKGLRSVACDKSVSDRTPFDSQINLDVD